MLLDDFLRYVKVSTQSDEESIDTPSTSRQWDLLKLLEKELRELGVSCELDKYGRLYGYIPGDESLDSVGLCAHVDTATECSGENVKPQVLKYEGKDVELGKSGLVLSAREYPHLNDCVGKTIITTDGTTLLGADDKAGIAIIMDVVRNVLMMDKNTRRPMSILFTPDEEVGRGPEHFDLAKYRAKFAYTIDGASINKISIENFNAKKGVVTIYGKSIHPGEAKGKLINACLLAIEFNNLLPQNMIPSLTEKYEGFNHLQYVTSDVEKATLDYILRNHDSNILEKQVNDFYNAKSIIEKKYPSAKVDIAIKDQYKNMIEIINAHPECKTLIEKVYKKLGIPFTYDPIRGGTDGATFSFNGCPCPNLGTGSYNHHGRYEYAVLEEMEIMSKICTELYKTR
ncbi:MAG: peptidase T [Bacilli bacterium]|nr:peptidase T [Bacilli bacterium]